MPLGRIALLACLAGLLLTLEGNSLSDQATCAAERACGRCIGTAGCSWCSTNPFINTRCIPRGFNTTCSPVNIEDPTGRVMTITTVPVGEESNNPVTTTNVRLALRVGEPVTFRVQVTPRRNQPLDLYVLIDLSASMSDELDAFRGVAGQIAGRILEVTSNVRLGFGSFNDKFTRPYTRMLVVDDNYAFWHRITLTDDTTSYSNNVMSVTTTTNADNPENGLEGLAQVLTCEDVIGWRDRSATGPERGLTRVVLFMTDDAFHYSGEGQLAGILQPYNGKCLIDVPPDNGPVNFTRYDEFDYPSVGQIVDLLAEREVVAIFAVQEARLRTYQNLVNLIQRKYRASVARLESDADAILDLIDTEITRILQEVILLPGASDDLTFDIQAECPGNANLTADGGGCDNVVLEDTVNFTMTVTLRSCDTFGDGDSRTRQVRVTAPSFGEFTITYDALCDCTCEENAVVNSTDCNGKGSFTCGVCECNPGYCGPACEFLIGNRSATDCPRNDENDLICSGSDRGICNCFCQCQTFDDGRVIMGDACQCDNYRCNDNNIPGEVCSGRGDCCNSVCMCESSELGNIYRGDDCECEPEVEICINPDVSPSEICSGRGTCGCTACDCPLGFSGPYCNIATPEFNCAFDDHEACIVSCVGMDTKTAPDLCNTTTACAVARSPIILFRDGKTIDGFMDDQERNNFIFSAVNMQLRKSGDDEFNDLSECSFTDMRTGCMYMYYLVTNPVNSLAILAERPPECPATGFQLAIPPYALAIIILAILLILGILILVLIKILFLILDAIEYRKWKNDVKNADFSKNQNPLYQSPEMKYENVAYGRE